MGKKISELTNRQQLSGNEDLPLLEVQVLNGSGIMIYYAGNDTWVDALGRYV